MYKYQVPEAKYQMGSKIVFMFRLFLHNSVSNTLKIFGGWNLVWHAFAAGLTIILVLSGADWMFFEITRSNLFHPLIWAAGIGGFFTPVLIPLALYLWGEFRSRRDLMDMGAAAGQAAILAYLISIMYKAVTGRVEPEFLTTFNMIDNSRDFNFGFLEYGVFWGWPSSHTAVAFASSFAIVYLTHNRAACIFAILYALFIGAGAAIGFHWLSDVLAGAIIGTLVGIVVARSFAKTIHSDARATAGI